MSCADRPIKDMFLKEKIKTLKKFRLALLRQIKRVEEELTELLEKQDEK